MDPDLALLSMHAGVIALFGCVCVRVHVHVQYVCTYVCVCICMCVCVCMCGAKLHAGVTA